MHVSAPLDRQTDRQQQHFGLSLSSQTSKQAITQLQVECTQVNVSDCRGEGDGGRWVGVEGKGEGECRGSLVGGEDRY